MSTSVRPTVQYYVGTIDVDGLEPHVSSMLIYCLDWIPLTKLPHGTGTGDKRFNTIPSSVADPGCLCRIPDVNFSIPDPCQKYPGSWIRIRIKEFKHFQCCGSDSEIRCLFDRGPGSGIRISFFSRISDPGIPTPYFLELGDKFLGIKFYNFLKTGQKFFLRQFKK